MSAVVTQRLLWRVTASVVTLLLTATLLLGACSLLPAKAPGVPAAIPVETGGIDAGEAAARAEAALSSARQAWQAGDALTVMAITTAALRDAPPADFESALRELRSRAREALVAEQVVKLSVVPVRDAVADGDDASVDILVRNVSAAPLTLPAQEGESSRALIILEVSRDDFDVYGNVRTAGFSVRVPLEGDLTLPPGGETTLRATIPAKDARLSHLGFSVLTIGGTFRPVAVRVGATEFFDALEIESALVRVFMQGFEQLTADPIGSLTKAVAKRSPPHILTAAELLPPGDRPRGIELLDQAAEDDPQLAFVLEAAADRLRTLASPASFR